jgi:signal transduction histidine kinase
VAAWALAGVAAAAQPVPPPEPWARSLAERQPLTVGSAGDGYPYSFYNEQGRSDGFAADLLDAVGRTMNLRFNRVSHPNTASYTSFRQGEFDLLQLLSETPEREEFAEFSVPFLTLQGAVFVRRDGPVRTLEDLNRADLAIIGAGSIGERFLRDRGLHPRVRHVVSVTEALRLIETGQCAGAFVTQLTARSVIRKNGLKNVVMLGAPLEGYDVRYCFAVHRGDAQLLARINEGLAILHENGEFDRIYRKWFSRVTGVLFTREEVISYVAAALALACGAALWGVWRQRVLRRRIEQLNAGLAAGIAARTAELAARVAEVERLNAEQTALMRDLQASRQGADRAAARLQEVNANLLGANQELEAFSYSVSHDLRAPVRNITGLLELLALRTAGSLDAEGSRFVATAEAEARRMAALIDALLEFSRVGRMALAEERVELAEVVAAVRAQLAPELAGRNVEWRIGALPAVRGDRTLLHQVMANLLGNAVKFTARRERAVIAVEAEPAGGEVTVTVRDNGAGFDPKYGEKLFGVFQRLHGQRDFGGVGIGLANVKRIVERHGGRVWAEGKVDNGAVFKFNVPAFSP